jgi:hypothetical protein
MNDLLIPEATLKMAQLIVESDTGLMPTQKTQLAAAVLALVDHIKRQRARVHVFREGGWLLAEETRP